MNRPFAKATLAVLLLPLVLASPVLKAEEAPAASPLSPAAERATFRLADENLLVELVAGDDEVNSPVAITWDAAGRMFVAEMGDYPVGPERGRIRLLADRDRDGRYETSQVFADSIPFPTGVLAVRDGLLVTAAPDILFLQDTDGDGRADRREALLTGFGEGNQQLRVNGLIWGADNWIYGANGRSDGLVRRPSEPVDRAVSIRGRDFRFRPDGSRFEAVTGQSQFGLARDDWGQRFVSWNTVPLRHALLEQSILDRHPQLTEFACRDIAEPGGDMRVFPISPGTQVFNKEPAGFFNALCGLTIFRGDALGADYTGDAFVCESLRNLVHRRKLVADGPSFRSKRAIANGEFLAAADPWFHPVFLATGPDGALYIADFYRRWVEHPQWVADEAARRTIDWREGAAHGRIWRVRRRDVSEQPADVVQLDRAGASELVQELSHANGWRRDTAQRLLVERQAVAAAGALVQSAHASKTPLARAHALWTLAGLNAAGAEVLERSLADPSAQVRRQAVRLAEPLLPESPPLRAAVFAAAGDDDPAVRFEVALAIGDFEEPAKDAAVARLAAARNGGTWDAVGLQIAIGPSAWRFLKDRIGTRAGGLSNPNQSERQLWHTLGLLVGRKHDEREVIDCLGLLAPPEAAAAPTGALTILSGLAEGMSESGSPIRQLRKQPPAAMAHVLRSLPNLLTEARRLAMRDTAPPADRLMAVRVLAHCGTVADGADLLELMAADQSQELSLAAADAAVRLADANLARQLFAAWSSYTTATRRGLPSLALRSPVAAGALVAALESKTIRPLEIEPAVRDLLARLPDKALAERAQQVFASVVPADRRRALAEYAGALELAADRRHGAALVTQHCLNCHQIQGRGQRVGPDLSSLSQPKDQLLVSLLDPSRQVSPDYLAYTLVTVDGQIFTGMVAGETANTVTLRRAEGADETIGRQRIEVLEASGKSLMPEGLEQKLALQDVADVLEFLKTPDATLLGTPGTPPQAADAQDIR